MTTQRLMDDRAYIEEIMERTAQPTDIWQDRFIYMMARAIYDILDELIRRKMNEDKTR